MHFMLVCPLPLLVLSIVKANQLEDFYGTPDNVTRTTPAGIAEYRSALTLDWLAAEDTRQRELVAAIESDPFTLSKFGDTDCMSYARPSSGTVARLMLELMKSLEGVADTLVPDLIQALVRTKLLALDPSTFENEPDFDSLVKTPDLMMGEPHTTFPRIIATLWMAVTDPSTVKKYGWCTVRKMNKFLMANRPSDIAKHMRSVESVIVRARFIMEEFIQHVTPINMLSHASTTKKVTVPARKPRRFTAQKNNFLASNRKPQDMRHKFEYTSQSQRTSTRTEPPPFPIEAFTDIEPRQEEADKEYKQGDEEYLRMKLEQRQLEQRHSIERQQMRRPKPFEKSYESIQEEQDPVPGSLISDATNIRVYNLPFIIFVLRFVVV